MTDFVGGGHVDLPEFRVGTVLADTFKAFFSNFFRNLGFGLLTYGPAYGLLAIYTSMQQRDITQAGVFPDSSLIFIQLLAVTLATVLCQTAMVYTSLETPAGRSTSFVAAGINALKGFVPVLCASVVIMLVHLIGGFLLLIPGLVAVTILCVAVPSILAENIGVFAALKRSAVLTHGNRWAVFGCLVSWFIMIWIAMMLVMFISTLLVEFISAPLIIAFFSLLPLLVMLVLYSTFSACVASIYTNLRACKEGASAETIERVFA
jgi:hypothetical protein